MTKHVTLIPIGQSYGIIIPDEVIERLGLKPGDCLRLDELSDTLQLKAADLEFDRQMAVAREVMQKNWNVLRALAK